MPYCVSMSSTMAASRAVVCRLCARRLRTFATFVTRARFVQPTFTSIKRAYPETRRNPPIWFEQLSVADSQFVSILRFWIQVRLAIAVLI